MVQDGENLHLKNKEKGGIEEDPEGRKLACQG